MDKEEDLRRRIAALEELIALEDNARLTDLKAKHLDKMSAALLQARQRARDRHTNRLQDEIKDLKQQLKALRVAWEAGTKVDEYTLQRVLGSGGNGQVWLAEEPLSDGRTRPVAIKVLRDSIAQKIDRVKRFSHEISTMARLYHRHIVPIYTYGDQGGQLYAVMPYFAGGTLRERLTGQPIDEAQSLTWLEQIGAALDHVHRYSGLIHRDVKPENMLLSGEDDTLYLADFGLVFSSEDDEHLTKGDEPVGTGRYMAPEQWNREPLSRKTDLYALGIVAYELFTGHLPFQEKNDHALSKAHCERDLPPDSHLTDEVLSILRKAAAKNPDDRYPTARAFLSDLRNWREKPVTIPPRIHDYLKWVTEELYDKVREEFVDLSGDEKRLRRFATKPKPSVWDEEDLINQVSAERQADHLDEVGTLYFVPNVRERLLTVNRAVLVGEPGSGKSWMLRHLQVDYARAWLTGDPVGRGLVPVRIKLNEYTGGPFVEMVKAAMDMLAPYYDQLHREQKLVILCDALNEMPRGNKQMQSLIEYLKTVNYFVVACRARDYRDDLNDLKPLEQVILRELELPAIRELIQKRLPDELGEMLWQSMGGTEKLEQFWQKVQEHNESAKFWSPTTEWGYTSKGRRWQIPKDWEDIHLGSRLIPLCRNPYMGDLLCRVYREGMGSLPDSRARLFEQFIEEMLRREAKTASRRGESFPSTDDIKDSLVSLAWTLQNIKRTVIRETQAMRALQTTSLEDKAASLMKAATDANILSNDGEGLRFTHQLLQEYFATRILWEAMQNGESAAQFFGREWWEPGVWRETIVILGEFLGEGIEGPNHVMRWLAPVTPEIALDVITRHGAGLTLHDVEPDTKRALIESARAKTREVHPVGRAAAYRVLGLWGEDRRSGVGILPTGLPDIEWMTILGGKFTCGHDDEGDNPAQILNMTPFRMSRFPITYAQFHTFLLDEDGFNNPLWWDGLADDELRRENQSAPEEQSFQYSNHPRETVSWYDAIAFCRWLSARLGGGYDLDNIADWAVRLPTEYEWEKAARGRIGSIYPYGNDFDTRKGNTYETGIGKTSAVGVFSLGASPYRIEEMSGNVWEWCLTDYENPCLDPIAENLHSAACRVIRGGSWNGARGRSRATYRLYHDPYARLNIIGFRCVQPIR
jgi:serine/threonine protein kinase/formylglycine-generating enzyme required for sulfatase activity